MLTDAVLRRLGIDAGEWLAPLNEACTRYDIDNVDRIAAFMAQCLHESEGFSRLVEDLNYSPARLCAVWPSRFTADEAVQFAHDEKRIAERVYGGRMGNGPEGSGDGYAYRGRGLLQLTGRGMYRKASVAIGPDFEAQPVLLEMPTWAAITSAWVWADEKRCNELADGHRFLSITMRICGTANARANGMRDRLAWHDKVLAAMAAAGE